MHPDQADPQRHQLNRVLVIDLLADLFLLFHEFEFLDVAFELEDEGEVPLALGGLFVDEGDLLDVQAGFDVFDHDWVGEFVAEVGQVRVQLDLDCEGVTLDWQLVPEVL